MKGKKGIISASFSILALELTLLTFVSFFVSIDYEVGMAWLWLFSIIVFIIIDTPKYLGAKYKSYLRFAWIFKALVVMGVGIIVENYYRKRTGMDAQVYHSLGVYVASFIKQYGELPFVPSKELFSGTTHYIIQTGVFYYIFGSYYNMMRVIDSFISFIGVILYSIIIDRTIINKKRIDDHLYLFLLFFPSINYWTSIHGKDPWMFFYIALGFFSAYKIFQKLELISVFGLLFAIAGMMWIRPHIAGIFVLTLIVYLFIINKKKYSKILPGIAIFTLSTLLLVITGWIIIKGFKIHSINDITTFIIKQGKITSTLGNSRIKLPKIVSLTDWAIYFPYGLVTVIFRPFVWESRSVFSLISAIENLFFLAFLLFYLKDKKLKPKTEIGIFSLIYILIFVGIFYPASGNLGTLVRQRIQVIPAIFIYVFSLKSK